MDFKIDPRAPEHIVSHRSKIQADAGAVWKVISTPGNLNLCHPFCKKNKVLNWGGVGATDIVEYYNGLVLRRIFTDWNEGKGFELLIGKGTYALARVSWAITALEEGTAELSIRIHSFPDVALSKYPRPLRRLISKVYFLPNMSKYIKAVVKGFKYYIETGLPVEMNQFGTNQMFSIHEQVKPIK